MDGFTYDVFLSFRGLDTRHGFTGNLYKALKDKGIRTFFDKEDIPTGGEISPSLHLAIKQSRMAIVVLSPNYATSSFCLNELSHILDCIKGKGRLVWPVFYDVNPSDVRWLKKTYGEAMDKHEASSRYNTDTIQKWKNTLHQVANLSSTPFKNGGEYEYEFIERIVKEVSRQIKPFTLYVADYLVGLESQKQDVISLLNVGLDDEVHMVGIHGIGGIGKTTLALAVYNSIAHQFGGLCFLEKVRENSEKLTYLQKILLSKAAGEKEIELTSVNEGIQIIQQRLRQIKVLLILDDVDELEQLQAIVGRPEWFGPGSRVIITTRDTGLLRSHGVKITQEVKGLNKEDALDLLRWRTSKSNNDSSSWVDILNRAVTYASGLPLALEVMGSHLAYKGIEECESALDRYEKILDKNIQKVLKVSFDALNGEEKSVFLDIACCFKGRKLAEVEEMLHAHHGDSKKYYIGVLVEKSLIKISESGYVTLHDLIEDMGKEIVRQDSPNEPGKRSRLWHPKDIVQVLEESTGTDKIEIIYYDSSISIKCDEEAFKKMDNLKTLITKRHIPSKYLPNSLRILEWNGYSSSCLPFDFYPKKLVICKLTSIKWEGIFKKKFESMRVLSLESCVHLTKIPDVSSLPTLEKITLQHCDNLITNDDSVRLLDKLKIFNVYHCRKLTNFPPLKLDSLEELEILHCGSLESFPPVVNGLLDKLKILSVKYCKELKSFPPLKLDSLKELNILSCYSLESFPPVVDGLLDKLKFLRANHCRKLERFPPLKLASLEYLDITHCDNLKSFPPVVDGLLDKLKTIHASYCYKIKSFPPLKLDSLEEINISSCYSLSSFPPVVDGLLDKLKILRANRCRKLKRFPPLKLDSLEELNISNCESLESFPPVVDGMLDKLKILRASYCRKLKSFPPLKLDSLEELDISYCGSLESFPPVVGGLLDKLKILRASYCKKLRSFSPLKLDSLEELDISHCGSLESFPTIVGGLLNKLEILRASYCRKLRSFPPLKLTSLEELDISYCDSLDSFPPVLDGLLDKLKILRANYCSKLRSFSPLKLDSLEELDISYCSNLESFPPVVGKLLDKLKILRASYCKKLKSFPPLKLNSLEELDISHCGSLEKFPEVLGEMENIKQLQLEKTPIKELPFSFRNFTRLQRLYLSCCGVVRLPSCIVVMSELVELTIVDGGWLFPKQDEGEEKVSPMQYSSRVELLHLRNCNLSDESLAIGLKWFANVKELDLSGSNFTALPECIENCLFLWKLILEDCEELQEIKGIPQSLKFLSALNCKHLTLSYRNKLLNQELHEAGNTWFCLPGAEIPEWFEHQCMEGRSISFWFRNKFPVIVLCVVPLLTWDESESPHIGVSNTRGTSIDASMNYSERCIKQQKTYHLHIFNMQSGDIMRGKEENKWSHVEVQLGFTFQKIGIHVLNEISNMEDIRFTNPENDVL